MLGTQVGNEWIMAVTWCVALAVFGYVAARKLFDRRAEH